MQGICQPTDWINGDWTACLFDPVVALIGESTWGLLIGVAIWGALYMAGNGSPVTPTVVTILLAALLFPTLPGAYVGIAWSVLLVVASAAMLQVLQKFTLSPATQ